MDALSGQLLDQDESGSADDQQRADRAPQRLQEDVHEHPLVEPDDGLSGGDHDADLELCQPDREVHRSDAVRSGVDAGGADVRFAPFNGQHVIRGRREGDGLQHWKVKNVEQIT